MIDIWQKTRIELRYLVLRAVGDRVQEQSLSSVWYYGVVRRSAAGR